MKPTSPLVILAALFFWGALSANAETVTANVSYQGYLTDAAGAPLHTGVNPTNVELAFRIWDESQGGTLLWTEKQTVSVLNGNFSTLLGAGGEIVGEPRPDLDTVFNPTPLASDFRYMEVTMGARTFLPRQRMVSNPYAFRAKVAQLAESVPDGSIGALQIANQSVTGTDLADSSVGSVQIADGAIRSTDIANGTVTSEDIANGTITSTDIANGTVTGADIANDTITAADIQSTYGLLRRSGPNRHGIGTSSPTAPLDVRGYSSIYMIGSNDGGYQRNGQNYGFWFAFLDDQRNSRGSYNNSVSIRSERGVLSGSAFYITSDRRVKNRITNASNEADLELLANLKVRNYGYKDVVRYGSGKKRGFIAQEVAEIMPYAITKSTANIPDIYQMAESSEGWIQLETALQPGDRVRLIDSRDQDETHEVLAVADGKFRTAFEPHDGKVFVYGREVRDFHGVDYDAVTVLNVSATQQLKTEVDALRAENVELRKRLDTLEALTRRLVKADRAAPAAQADRLVLIHR